MMICDIHFIEMIILGFCIGWAAGVLFIGLFLLTAMGKLDT